MFPEKKNHVRRDATCANRRRHVQRQLASTWSNGALNVTTRGVITDTPSSAGRHRPRNRRPARPSGAYIRIIFCSFWRRCAIRRRRPVSTLSLSSSSLSWLETTMRKNLVQLRQEQALSKPCSFKAAQRRRKYEIRNGKNKEEKREKEVTKAEIQKEPKKEWGKERKKER